ncbi:MAG: hypothetical protein LQ339_002129 [Xanthoria mediterranea]|nr:MAG: hypothetical protein LQ339_002129 [Xanthoria mediterranea]
MAKSARKPKGKPIQSPGKENTERVKESRVAKPAKKSPARNILQTPSKHGMRTRAKSAAGSDAAAPCSTPPNRTKPSDIDASYFTSLSQELLKTPKTTKSRRTRRAKNAVKTPQTPPNKSPSHEKRADITFVWDLLATDRSFWDPIRETSSGQSASGRNFADMDVNEVMKRLNREIAYRIDTYKIEDHGYMSSSSPGGHDPREQIPVTEEEKGELQLALFPSLQHLVELTKYQPRRTDVTLSYLDQFRALHTELQDIWRIQGHTRATLPLFQLEAWKGGIVGWRSSHYTTGDERFSAAIVDAHFQTWRVTVPSTSPIIDYSMPDIDDSDLEMQSLDPRRYINSSSPLHGHDASPTPLKGNHRRAMSALYDKDRDMGFLPTPHQIQSYQAGEASSTTLPGLGMSDPGIIDFNSSDPIQEANFRGGGDIRIYEEGNVTPPPPQGNEPPGYTSSQASASSNKENDRYLMNQVMEEQRLAEMRTPSRSNSQDNIDPADERWARNERLGEVWLMEQWGDF